MDLYPEAKLVKQRTRDDAVGGTEHHKNEDLDSETDENGEYTEAANNPQYGGGNIIPPIRPSSRSRRLITVYLFKVGEPTELFNHVFVKQMIQKGQSTDRARKGAVRKRTRKFYVTYLRIIPHNK